MSNKQNQEHTKTKASLTKVQNLVKAFGPSTVLDNLVAHITQKIASQAIKIGRRKSRQ